MKYSMKFALAVISVLPLSVSMAQLPEPYQSIQVLPYDMHGWFKEENQVHLKKLIARVQPNVVVELGTWLGWSAIYMAECMKPAGILYAVDNWTAQGDISILNDQNPETKKRIPTLYEQFLSNVIHKNLCHKITPVRMDTIEAAQRLEVKADLIYVDASHDEESVFKDIMNWYPKLNKGGIMCGDDALSKDVLKAAQRAAAILHLTLLVDGNFWYFDQQ